MPNPDPSGSPDMHPRNEQLESHQEIVDRDFLLHNFLTLETPMNKTPMAPDPLPPVLGDG
jgi:hypothetical protein